MPIRPPISPLSCSKALRNTSSASSPCPPSSFNSTFGSLGMSQRDQRTELRSVQPLHFLLDSCSVSSCQRVELNNVPVQNRGGTWVLPGSEPERLEVNLDYRDGGSGELGVEAGTTMSFLFPSENQPETKGYRGKMRNHVGDIIYNPRHRRW